MNEYGPVWPSMAQYGFHFHPPICGHGCNSCRYTKHVSGHWRLWLRILGLVYKLKVLHFHRTLKTTPGSPESKYNAAGGSWFHDTCCSTVLKWHDHSFASFIPSFDLKTIFAPASSSSWPLREKPQNRPQIRPMGHGNMGQNTVIHMGQGDLCGCDARNMMNLTGIQPKTWWILRNQAETWIYGEMTNKHWRIIIIIAET